MRKYILLFSIFTTLASSLVMANGDEQYKPFAPDGIQFVVADSAFMPDMKGNHRAVVKVASPNLNAVVVSIPWRRPDLRPETKKIVVYAAKTGKEVINVSVLEFSAEKGRIVFQPQAGETDYYVYYLPYKFRKGWDDARYGEPWNDYLAPAYNADPNWVASVKKNAAALPAAKVERIESRSKFDAFTSMGLIATKKEIADILRKHKEDFLVYTEDREFPIRLPYSIPARWAKRTPALFFKGDASKNEYYCWQIGLWAVHADIKNVRVAFSDFTSGSNRISKDSVTCFNQEGINWDGKPVNFAVNVSKGNVQALWCGIQIPRNAKAGTYTGTATLTADGAAPRKIKVTIRVNEKVLADKGDGDPWRHSRLRWLNSTIGSDDLPVKPYSEMKISGNTILASGKTLVIGKNGLPEVISINNRQVLAKPITFEVLTAMGTVTFTPDNLEIKQVSAGKVTWTSSSVQSGLKFTCNATME